MVGICPKCGSHAWDKTVSGTTVCCQKCGHTWQFQKMPLFILTGCSGVGKTTTAQELLLRGVDFVVLDADAYYSIMSLQTQEDYLKKFEHMQSLSKNIMQSGRPVLWTVTGNLPLLRQTYSERFFSDIYCLALVCEEHALRHRMTEGRRITDSQWIESSVDYNRYFQTHTQIENMPYTLLDITDKSVAQVADDVAAWVNVHRMS